MSCHSDRWAASGDLAAVEDAVKRRYLSDASQMERIERLVELVPANVDSLLDVGAGYGVFLHTLLEQREILAEGIDIVESYFAWGRARGVKLTAGSAHRLPFEDGQFDMIACSEVLEHLHWRVYEESQREFARVAKNWILVSVPFDERRGFCRCPYCRSGVNPDNHLRSFRASDLGGLFPGFTLVKTSTICKLSVVTMLKAVLPLPWSSGMVCPSCGYRHTQTRHHVSSDRFAKLKGLLRSLPLPKRPRWLVGLYRRSEKREVFHSDR